VGIDNDEIVSRAVHFGEFHYGLPKYSGLPSV